MLTLQLIYGSHEWQTWLPLRKGGKCQGYATNVPQGLTPIVGCFLGVALKSLLLLTLQNVSVLWTPVINVEQEVPDFKVLSTNMIWFLPPPQWFKLHLLSDLFRLVFSWHTNMGKISIVLMKYHGHTNWGVYLAYASKLLFIREESQDRSSRGQELIQRLWRGAANMVALPGLFNLLLCRTLDP